MSSLFNSLSYFVGKDGYEIRQMICNYLEENKPIIEGLETFKVIQFDNENAENYISKMRLPSTLGGAIELQCACNIWNYKINVLNYRERNNTTIEFIPLNGNIEKTINVYWTGNHYEPIKE